nr:hypothetical protein [Candidatus Cloacimonadota bacterium]
QSVSWRNQFDDSSWILPYGLAKSLFLKAKNLFSDIEFIGFVEIYLDLDREESEWENLYTQK